MYFQPTLTLRLHLDFETASTCDLKTAGVARYAEQSETFTWGFSWGFGDGLEYTWTVGDPFPQIVADHVAAGGTVVAHNAAFERWIWNKILRAMFPWLPELRIEQQNCTMARAAAMGLPMDLDTLGRVLGLTEKKDDAGSTLMKKMMRPRKVHPDGSLEWHNEPENIQRLMYGYCPQDVRTEICADVALPELSAHEHALWQLDQKINDRGVYLDIEAITRAVDIAEIAKKAYNNKMQRLTNGAVKTCRSDQKIVEFINARGFDFTTVRKSEHEAIIEMAGFAGDELVREIVELRKEASKTSTAKYSAMLKCICDDGRARGLLAYHAAHPGRWGGRLFQPQNMPRVDPDTEGQLVEFVIATLGAHLPLRDIYEIIEMGAPFGVLHALSKALRGMIRAEPGNKLIGGDFSNIEGRGNAWLAREEWKIQAFRDFDAGIGHDLYKITAASILGKRVEDITKLERQAYGKVPELALGYQGGVGAFITMGDTYNVKPWDLVQPVVDTVPAQQWDETAIRYASSPDKFGLPEDQWTAIKIIVTNWRKANANITQGWWDLADSAVQAVTSPGYKVPVYHGRASYLCTDGWLYCQLPSGRVLAYCEPHVETTIVTLVNKRGEEFEREKHTVTFWGKDSKKGNQWRKRYLYGGLQCENIVQATARCVLDRSMFRLEEAGYPLILTVHDENLSEVPRDFGSAEEYERIMAIPPEFADGLPIAVSAWEDERYVK